MYSQQFLRKWVEMFDIVEQFKVLKSYLKNLCVMLSVYFVQRCIMYIDWFDWLIKLPLFFHPTEGRRLSWPVQLVCLLLAVSCWCLETSKMSLSSRSLPSATHSCTSISPFMMSASFCLTEISLKSSTTGITSVIMWSCLLLLQAISTVITHFSIALSVCLSQACRLIKPFDRFRCYLSSALVIHCVKWRFLTPREGNILLVESPAKIDLWKRWFVIYHSARFSSWTSFTSATYGRFWALHGRTTWLTWRC